MTDERKPYEADWPHGYETRDGRKATEREVMNTRALYWEMPDGTLSMTGCHGRVSIVTDSPFDIFCTPAPVPDRIEGWGNAYGANPTHLHRTEKDARLSAEASATRTAVHMREVHPGDMTAEQVEALVNKICAEASRIVWTEDAKGGFISAICMIRAASRGEI